MNEPWDSDFLFRNGVEIRLKTPSDRSHNQTALERKRLKQLVTLMAQRAAQSDFDDCMQAQPHHHIQGDIRHGLPH
jgi:hypothetical protein